MYIESENCLKLSVVDGQVLVQYEEPPEDPEEPYDRKQVSKLFSTPDEAVRYIVPLLKQWQSGKGEVESTLDELYGAKK